MTTAAQTNRVAFLRRARGLSQVQLAVEAGLSLSTIYQVETGHTPRRRAQERLAAIFHVRPEDLFPDSE